MVPKVWKASWDDQPCFGTILFNMVPKGSSVKPYARTVLEPFCLTWCQRKTLLSIFTFFVLEPFCLTWCQRLDAEAIQKRNVLEPFCLTWCQRDQEYYLTDQEVLESFYLSWYQRKHSKISRKNIWKN